MKNLKKILIAAMSIAAIAMSTTAFAATEATYNADTKTVALTLAEGDVTATSGQMTVVVVPKTFGADSGAADIYYINQEEFGAKFTAILENMGLKGEIDPAGYEVRIGGENMASVAKFDFQVVAPSQFKLGDVNRSGGDPDILDASDIVDFVLGNIQFDEEQKSLGDVNKSGGEPDILDASDIVDFVLGNLSLE